MPERPVWFLLTRDISGSVRVHESPVVVGSVILDASTGLVRAVAIAATPRQARAQAIRQALDKPTRDAPPGPPAEVICGPGDAADLSRELAGLLERPAVTREGVSLEAEDSFDSMVGNLCGRRQPGTYPAVDDWAQLVAATRRYRLAEPWCERGDDRPLDLVVRLGVSARWVAVVLGQEGIQRGLVLYPGTDLPASVRRRPGRTRGEPRMPPGTLMAYLDPPADNPPEFAAKARRYGWPAGDPLSPAWVASAPGGGPADLDQAAAHTLVVAFTAVLAHGTTSHRHPARRSARCPCRAASAPGTGSARRREHGAVSEPAERVPAPTPGARSSGSVTSGDWTGQVKPATRRRRDRFSPFARPCRRPAIPCARGGAGLRAMAGGRGRSAVARPRAVEH